jgi:putative transport protein
MDDRLGQDLGLARTIGLALFVYTVGLASGSILIRTFRRQLPLMAGSALVLVVVGVGTVLLGRLLELSGAFQGGVFAGVGTSTPTLAAATVAAGGGTEPAVGYASPTRSGWSSGLSPSTWRWAALGTRRRTPGRRPCSA